MGKPRSRRDRLSVSLHPDHLISNWGRETRDITATWERWRTASYRLLQRRAAESAIRCTWAGISQAEKTHDQQRQPHRNLRRHGNGGLRRWGDWTWPWPLGSQPGVLSAFIAGEPDRAAEAVEFWLLDIGPGCPGGSPPRVMWGPLSWYGGDALPLSGGAPAVCHRQHGRGGEDPTSIFPSDSKTGIS